jgi:hypothetical protein
MTMYKVSAIIEMNSEGIALQSQMLECDCCVVSSIEVIHEEAPAPQRGGPKRRALTLEESLVLLRGVRKSSHILGIQSRGPKRRALTLEEWLVLLRGVRKSRRTAMYRTPDQLIQWASNNDVPGIKSTVASRAINSYVAAEKGKSNYDKFVEVSNPTYKTPSLIASIYKHFDFKE